MTSRPIARCKRVITWPFRRLRQTEAGQSLVEFSLVLPLMLIMLFALVDFGRAFHTWLMVTNAAREGARAAATQQDVGQIQTRINDSMQGLDTSRLQITVNNVQGPRGDVVEVDLAYDFNFVTPIGGMMTFLSGGAISAPTISSHSSMRLE